MKTSMEFITCMNFINPTLISVIRKLLLLRSLGIKENVIKFKAWDTSRPINDTVITINNWAAGCRFMKTFLIFIID
jgi:hypothetical protein